MDEQEAPRAPPFLGYFDLSNEGFAWRRPRPEQIERRRAAMDDVLIFDILLSSGGIRQPTELFPPSNMNGLVRLLHAIDGSEYDMLKKECLIYLLLKWHQDGREERFAGDRSLPPQFTSLADAYWHLDANVNVARAVAILSDARLNRDYASKIIHALSLSPKSAPLIINYVRTAKPLLVEPVDIDTYALALVETNLLEAWQFQRTFNDDDSTRSRLLEKILVWCISPKPRPALLAALLAFPLSPFEETFLKKCALQPPKALSTSSISVLRDLVCVRLIQSGNLAACIKLDHQFASSTLNESKADSQDRRKMVHDLYEALQPVERMLLDSELEGLIPITGPPVAKHTAGPPTPASNTAGALSISQSWEEIPRTASTVAAPLHDIIPPAPVVPISERARAPRFGKPIPSPRGILNAATASGTAPPLIPVSTLTPSTHGRSLISGSGPLTPSSLSFSGSRSMLPGSSKPRQSLAGTTPVQLFLGGASGSPAGGGLKPALSKALFPSTSITVGQAPASRKQNAFYNPPPIRNGKTGTKRSFDELEEPVDANVDGDEEEATKSVNERDEDVEKDRGHVNGKKQRSSRERDEEVEEEGAQGFQYSVFGNGNGNGPESPTQAQTNMGTASAPVLEKPVRRIPPGAFMTDEEEEEAPGEVREKTSPPPTISRGTRSSRGKAIPTPKATRRSIRHVKEADVRRSFPGSLVPSDNEEEEEEEGDYVAPLRQPSPSSRRPARKSRASTPSETGGDGDSESGVLTRRRSTRLTTTHTSASPERASPPPPKKKDAKGRKSIATASTKTAAATSGKKRR